VPGPKHLGPNSVLEALAWEQGWERRIAGRQRGKGLQGGRELGGAETGGQRGRGLQGGRELGGAETGKQKGRGLQGGRELGGAETGGQRGRGSPCHLAEPHLLDALEYGWVHNPRRQPHADGGGRVHKAQVVGACNVSGRRTRALGDAVRAFGAAVRA